MTVVYVEPHKSPYITEMSHTLEAEQKAVGGLIEPIYCDDVTCLYLLIRLKLFIFPFSKHFFVHFIYYSSFFSRYY